MDIVAFVRVYNTPHPERRYQELIESEYTAKTCTHINDKFKYKLKIKL